MCVLTVGGLLGAMTLSALRCIPEVSGLPSYDTVGWLMSSGFLGAPAAVVFLALVRLAILRPIGTKTCLFAGCIVPFGGIYAAALAQILMLEPYPAHQGIQPLLFALEYVPAWVVLLIWTLRFREPAPAGAAEPYRENEL